ncbi:MAG: hypothetical protein V4671_24745 [Armatimonadota bacterium]
MLTVIGSGSFGPSCAAATRFLLFCFVALLPSLFFAIEVRAADIPVSVLVESVSGPAVTSSRLETPSVSDSWLRWGRMGQDAAVFMPKVSPQGAAQAQAVRSVGAASVLIVPSTNGETVQAKAAARLEAGVYRVAAVVIEPAADPSAVPNTRAWRMESVLLSKPGVSTKIVRLRPGQLLIVRWTETISEARSVLQAARRSEAAQGGPTTYTGVTIARALGQAGRLLEEIQTLSSRGKRPEAIRRTHRALLYIAQAQAMARNRPGAVPEGENEVTFARLTVAFSEISAALSNLVPAESLTMAKDSVISDVKVSLTNAGLKPIPFVTLSLPASADAAQAAAESRRRVFRNVAPGATVSARFPVPSSSSEPASTVQFIQGVGAAVVTAAPPP